jgi:hypothetical protein
VVEQRPQRDGGCIRASKPTPSSTH